MTNQIGTTETTPIRKIKEMQKVALKFANAPAEELLKIAIDNGYVLSLGETPEELILVYLHPKHLITTIGDFMLSMPPHYLLALQKSLLERSTHER